VICVAVLILLAACGTRNTPVEPDPSDVLAVSASAGTARVYAEPGSADGGTTASIVAGGTGTATVETDGSFTIDVQLASASAVSQAATLIVEYTKAGFTLTSEGVVQQLSAQVTTPMFSTGAGPNDMVFGLDSLYVANSFDNTVVRYGLDGSEIASVAYDAYASPSYLALAGDMLWVAANGENTVKGFGTAGLAPDASQVFALTGEGTAFIGPGGIAAIAASVFIPRAEITGFGPPSVYAQGALDIADTGDGTLTPLVLTGKNATHSAYDAARDYLVVVCTGEVQFDEFWTPFVESSAYVEVYDVADNMAEVTVIDLGETGAGCIALDQSAGIVYLGNCLNGNLYKVDYVDGTVLRGEANPIVLTEEFTYISDVAFTPDGRYVLATSFNTDELYVIDTATDTVNPGPYPAPFDLSLDPELMAGCANVEIDPTPRADGGYNAYVLYGIANAVAKVELIP
jgi:DNA-binding beta-propeller fold protein YncE